MRMGVKYMYTIYLITPLRATRIFSPGAMDHYISGKVAQIGEAVFDKLTMSSAALWTSLQTNIHHSPADTYDMMDVTSVFTELQR